jgi:hypothetical protein
MSKTEFTEWKEERRRVAERRPRFAVEPDKADEIMGWVWRATAVMLAIAIVAKWV